MDRNQSAHKETKAVMKEDFTSTLSNIAWREIRSRAPGLDLQETCCPRLDSLYNTNESQTVMPSRSIMDLHRIQALVLDVAAPLLELKAVAEDQQEILRKFSMMLFVSLGMCGTDVQDTLQTCPEDM